MGSAEWRVRAHSAYYTVAAALFRGLPRRSALFDSISALGTHARDFLRREEVTEADSARARIVTGATWARPGNCHGSAECRMKTSWPAPIQRKKPWCFSPSDGRTNGTGSRARCTLISEKKRKQVIPSNKLASQAEVFMDRKLF